MSIATLLAQHNEVTAVDVVPERVESVKAGFGGAIYGYAANQKVLEHYMVKMNATHVGILHPYQFCVFEKEMQEIMKTYTYAYSGEEI